jgi:hypothetical protein
MKELSKTKFAFTIYLSLALMFVAGYLQADIGFHWKKLLFWVIFYSALYWGLILIGEINFKLRIRKKCQFLAELNAMRARIDK